MVVTNLREFTWFLLLLMFLQLTRTHANVYLNHTHLHKKTGKSNEKDLTFKHFDHTLRSRPSMPQSTTTTTTTTTTTVKPPREKIIECNTAVALNFSRVGFNRIDAAFIRSSDVLFLDLSKNDINEISTGAFRYVPKLALLDLSGNKIPTEKLLFLSSLPNLRTLILSQNRGNESVLQVFYEPLLSLQELYLQSNNITNFDVNLTEFSPRLTKLYLTNNKIQSGEFLENLPVTLTHLYVEDNLITRIDAGVSANLIELHVNGNRIEQLCNVNCKEFSLSLSNSTRLRRFEASRNRINSVTEDAFTDMILLNHMDLADNKIDRLDGDTLNGLNAIESFNLRKNQLTTIPNLCAMGKLKTLDLSDNMIQDINSQSLCRSSVLKILRLNDNKIMNINAGAFNAPSLEDLDLSNNVINELPANWIQPANNLRVLQLRNNQIVKLTKLSLDYMSSLSDLHIEGNPFTSLQFFNYIELSKKLVLHVKHATEVQRCEDENNEAVKRNGQNNDYDTDSDYDID